MPEAYLEELSSAANELELGVPKCIDKVPPPAPDTGEEDEDDDDHGKKGKRKKKDKGKNAKTEGRRR